ncbi:MAG: hypothetical protein A4E65_01377 [Syntrophorhabdus sp. PtaU1.Bin153]|nr:MAG: hypothetical protein A4E65_01377 [Syntrophorhabdus sp. PtaU1.Bin153]
MSIAPFGTFLFALTVVSCHSITGTHGVAPTLVGTRPAKLSEPPAPASGYPARERAIQGMQTYAASRANLFCTIKSDLASASPQWKQRNSLLRNSAAWVGLMAQVMSGPL